MKIIKILSLLMLICSLLFLIASCGEPDCTHADKNDDEKCDLCGMNFEDGCDNHRDIDDNQKCDICKITFSDKCDIHVDKNDDGRCDTVGCPAEYEDGHDLHKDKNDDGKCDICNIAFTDGCDNHRDANDNCKCDICDIDFTDKCDIHRDINDDGECDSNGCTEKLDDGCDMHKDKDDDGKCDICGIDFTDGCDNHRDINDDGICDNGGEKYSDDSDVKTYTVLVKDLNGNLIKNVKFNIYNSNDELVATVISDKDGLAICDTWQEAVYVKVHSLPYAYSEHDKKEKYEFDADGELNITVVRENIPDYDNSPGIHLPFLPVG